MKKELDTLQNKPSLIVNNGKILKKRKSVTSKVNPRIRKRPPSQRAEEDEHAVLRLSLGGRENGWTAAINGVHSNPRYHSSSTVNLAPQPALPSNSASTTNTSVAMGDSATLSANSTTTLTNPNTRIRQQLYPARSSPSSATNRQIFLWVYKDPNHIHTLHMDRSNPSGQIREYIERMFYVENDAYTLASLVPGVAYPIPIMKFASDLNKGFIICLPTKSFVVHIAGNTGEETFSVKVNPLQTVRDLKVQIQQLKGYPTYVQDLLFDGHVLQNKHLVIDYKIANACRIQLNLQPCPSISVYVDTFWGKSYNIEISPCYSADDLLTKVFRKTLAKPAYREQIFQTRTMYQGLVLVEYEGTILDKKYCLNYYGVKGQSTLHILSTSGTRRDRRTTVHVLQDTGARLQVCCAPFDTWFILALQLHGLTTLYVDMMKLLISDRTIELQQPVGSPASNETCVQVTLVMLPPPSGIMQKLTVHVGTASGCVETVSCGARETIKDVKRRLEHAGVDYAAYHDILYKKVRLPGNTKLYEYKLNTVEKCFMDMKLGEFPVSVQHETTTVKFAANQDHTVSTLIRRIEDKMDVSSIKHNIIHAGEDLYTFDSLKISDTLLFINSQVYIEPLSNTRSLHLIASDVKVPLPCKHNLDNLHIQQLGDVCADPETFVEGLKWFLKWRFPIKSNIFNPRRPADIFLPASRPSSKSLNLGVTHIATNNSSANGRRTPGSASSQHNHLHERSACRSGSKLRRQLTLNVRPSAVTGDSLRNAVSDEEVYTQRQLAMLPDIAQNNKTTTTSIAGSTIDTESSTHEKAPSPLAWPKSAIKNSKSTDNIFASDSRETFESFSSMPINLNSDTSAKKKLSVRFDIPEGHEPPTREQARDRKLMAWGAPGSRNGAQNGHHSAAAAAANVAAKQMTPEDLIEYYQRLRIKRNSALKRAQSDRAGNCGTRGSKISTTPVSSVTVKFSMNV